MGPAERRLFVALAPPAELARELAERARAVLGADAAGLRLVRAESIHLTLLFLGAVEEERRPALERELGAGVDGAPAPRLSVGRPGAFPGRGRERVLWAAAEEPEGEALAGLHARVLGAAERAGFDVAEERGRPFRAHLTLARVEPRARVAGSFYELAERWSWTPSEVRLVETVGLGSGPPRYERRAGWALAVRPR